MTTLISKLSEDFSGQIQVPGDKSISHRALILASLALGASRIEGLLDSEDVMNTLRALQALGVGIRKEGGDWVVEGSGLDGLRAPAHPLDFGNSGTGARLMMGLLASQPFCSEFTGDVSLSRRPMGRVLDPLRQIGATILPEAAATLPLTLSGTKTPIPVIYPMPVASAQVKSAVLLAGLKTPGETGVIEKTPTRDHTERLLIRFGAEVKKQALKKGATSVTVKGFPKLKATNLAIPGDFSAAAFPLVAALIIPGAKVKIKNVGVNPLRTGLLEVLKAMGATVQLKNRREQSGEPVADLEVDCGPLLGVTTSPGIAPRMIDEYPILFAAAALAGGVSEFRGLGELRLKESDRLAEMAAGLKANGVEVEAFDDGLRIIGCGGLVTGGGRVNARHDHRIAMAFLVLGLRAKNPITVTGAESISTSFPGFAKLMRDLGADIKEAA